MSIARLVATAIPTLVLAVLPAVASAQEASVHDPATRVGRATTQRPAAQTVTVYRQKECECCGRWAAHLRKAGFPVKVIDVADVTATKVKYAVPEKLRSCHTALVGGYVVEGHVPADVIEKLLAEKPKDIVGLAAPGMPKGSPGMEMGGEKDHYEILAFDRHGNSTVYARR